MEPTVHQPIGGTTALVPLPLMIREGTERDLTRDLLRPVLEKPGRAWKAGLGLTGLGAMWFLFAIGVTFARGIGTWGNDIPVAWAFAITNFVWWIGIGHAGTLISAILFLLQQRWRNSINRLTEAMTLFAVMMAGLFPVLHLGRPWFAYWLIPYPAEMRVWPNFRSSLTWDVAAVSTYFTVSLLFWYLGLLPDLASARDVAITKWKKRLYGIFALGWRGSGRAWHHYRMAYLLLAGLATPLVLSVHTIVSFDFAIALLPGWHSTIFPPYFVAGAIFSGFAMVLTLVIPARTLLGLESVITLRHVENMCKVTLATGLMVAYAYVVEFFIGWYSGDPFEIFQKINSLAGPFAPLYWLMLFCNLLVPQLFWVKRFRRSLRVAWVASILINVGMWLERFDIIVISLHRDYLPSSWAMYSPSWVDWSLLGGSICTFLFLFLLFLRLVPPIPISETKELQHELTEEHGWREALRRRREARA